MYRLWLGAAALQGLLAVALGAYAAHGLRAPAVDLERFRTGVDYQMWHALALLAAATLRASRPHILLDVSAGLFLVGSALFCGSMYAIALTGKPLAPMLAPAGGLSLLAGWATLLLFALVGI